MIARKSESFPSSSPVQTARYLDGAARGVSLISAQLMENSNTHDIRNRNPAADLFMACLLFQFLDNDASGSAGPREDGRYLNTGAAWFSRASFLASGWAMC